MAHGVVQDLLFQHKYPYAHFPESVDLAAIATGLGVLRSQFDFVTKEGTFWDSTQWKLFPRPFLDSTGQLWAHAVSGWLRGNKKPAWLESLDGELRRGVAKNLKSLFSSGDCFVDPSRNTANWSQADWLAAASGRSGSGQSDSSRIIAARHLQPDSEVASQQQTLLQEQLRSTELAVVLNATSAIEQVGSPSVETTEELQFLTRHRDDEVRAKAMLALTRLGQLDPSMFETVGEFLDSKSRHVTFSGLMAVSSLGKIDDDLLGPIHRAFLRSLSDCNYEFVNLFAVAFTRWFDDPKQHVENILADHYSEYLEIAIEAIDNAKENFVKLDSQVA